MTFQINQKVKLLKDIIEPPNEHNPGCVCARKGEVVIVRKISSDITYPIHVSHVDILDRTFGVDETEIELVEDNTKGVKMDSLLEDSCSNKYADKLEPIDWKYNIQAINPCSKNTHTEFDSILFLAKDKAVPAMLVAYRDKCIELGTNPAHIEAIELLIKRVNKYQENIESKVPDTDLPCEILRCAKGFGTKFQAGNICILNSDITNIPLIEGGVVEIIASKGNIVKIKNINFDNENEPQIVVSHIDNPDIAFNVNIEDLTTLVKM